MTDADARREYLAKVGDRVKRHLDIITALSPFVNAMQTDLGAELLKDDIERHSILINKIFNDLIEKGAAEQKDVIELKLRQERLQTVYDRMKQYYVSEKMIKKVEEMK